MNTMHRYARSISLLFAAVLITACTSADNSSAVTASPEANYAALIEQAHKANEKVVALEHQWTTVPALLKQAEQAATEGDFTRASKFANEALKHAELGIAQAEEQAKVWVHLVPR